MAEEAGEGEEEQVVLGEGEEGDEEEEDRRNTGEFTSPLDMRGSMVEIAY